MFGPNSWTLSISSGQNIQFFEEESDFQVKNKQFQHPEAKHQEKLLTILGESLI